MQKSPPDSPFAWVAFDAKEAAALPGLPTGDRPRPRGCIQERDLVSPPVTVAVGADSIWILDRTSRRLTRVVQFPGGFPSVRSGLSALGNSALLAIASNGSVVFHAGGHLYFWELSTGELRLLAEEKRQPEAIAVSPAARRVATLRSGGAWQAKAWSVPEGKLLATLSWDNAYPGALSRFEFARDGDGLSLTIDVAAQSGSDFTEHHGWSLGAGPE